MRTIVQISDLHFGAILEPTLDPLIAHITSLRPDLTIVSGDLTQRAKEEQFERARTYVARLPTPRMIIPGNHDVPLYDVFRRFLSPLGRYTSLITDDLSPTFVDDEVAIVGINTARSLVFKGGGISDAQIEKSAAMFEQLPPNVARIVVTHHPWAIPDGLSGVEILDGADKAMVRFEACDVDLFLAGHLHLVHVASAASFRSGYKAMLLQAGTATSSRARGEPNSFFVIRVDSATIETDTYTWDGFAQLFKLSSSRTFERVSGGKNSTAAVIDESVALRGGETDLE